MRRDPINRHLVVAFVLAMVLYAVAFKWIEHRRTRKGGWQVTFLSDSSAQPSIQVAHPWLHITNVTFTFPGVRVPISNLLSTVRFDQPVTNIPFGKVVYLDTTFLPGSVVFHLYGHEIQLLPRVLLLDRQEIPWTGRTHFQLAPSAPP